MHLDRLYADMAERLSPRMVRYVHTIIRKALSDAVKKGLVVRNVADAATPPSAKSTKAPEMTTWTPEQLRTFLDGIASNRYFPLLGLAAMTGLRRGEVLGLRWSDIDFDEGRLVVRQQVPAIAREVSVGELKTAAGRRTITLDARTIEVLREHRRRQVEEHLVVGAGYVDHGLVFAGIDGAPIHPRATATPSHATPTPQRSTERRCLPGRAIAATATTTKPKWRAPGGRGGRSCGSPRRKRSSRRADQVASVNSQSILAIRFQHLSSRRKVRLARQHLTSEWQPSVLLRRVPRSR